MKLNQKGFSLLTAIFVMLALGTIALAMTAMLSTRANSSTADMQAIKTFYAAEGVLHYVIEQYFASDPDFSDNVSPTAAGVPISFAGASATVAYSAQTANSATITVTAQLGNSTRVIRQTISQTLPLNYVGACLGNMHAQGTGTITGNLSSNGNILISGLTVNGTLTDNNTITLPTVSMQKYIDMTSSTHSGNLNITGNYSGNVHVTGDVNIANNAVVSGIIIADGRVDIGKNVTVTGTLGSSDRIDSNDLDTSSLSGTYNPVRPVLVTTGTITLVTKGTGSSTISGLVLAQGTINYQPIQNSTIIFHGIMYSNDQIIPMGPGNMTITYDPTLAAAMGSDNLKLTLWKEM